MVYFKNFPLYSGGEGIDRHLLPAFAPSGGYTASERRMGGKNGFYFRNIIPKM